MNSEDSAGEEEILITFNKRDEVKMKLSKTAQKNAEQVSKNSQLSCLINNHLDPQNRAQAQHCTISLKHNVEFQHYFLKHKHKHERQKVFDQMKNLLIERGYNQISQIRDREQEQIMVVRVVAKVQNALNTFIIEDEFTRDKLTVRQGIMWIGMICAIRAKWIQGTYKLDKIIDLSTLIPQTKATLAANLTVNRIMFIKGPFRPKFSNHDQGIRIVCNQIKKLKKRNVIINQLVVMGPLLAKNNKSVLNFTFTRTYEQQYELILTNLRKQISQINSQIAIYVMPSLDDIVSLYPIPQPAYVPEDKKIKIKHISNPSAIQIEGRRSVCKIDLVNYDVLKYIDTHKQGKATKNLLIQNFESYIKQPFYLSNTISSQDAFDEVNMGQLYNNGNFGDLIVYSSTYSPPLANQVNGRIMLNIGSLGVESNYTGKNYIVYASIFEGQGPVAQRIKVQMISYG